MTRPCFICRADTERAFCAGCEVDITYLGAPLPDPKATTEELKEWAKTHEVSFFSCGKAATGEEPW